MLKVKPQSAKLCGMKKPLGAPSIYTPELAQSILDRLELGQSLRKICEDPAMPSGQTIRNWINAKPDFFAQYTRSRDIGLDAVADEVIAIADEIPGMLDNGATDSGGVAHQRLRFDARRWYLSKLAPKRYGDKLTTEVTGANGGAIQVDDSSTASRLAAILDAAKARRANETPEDDLSDIL